MEVRVRSWRVRTGVKGKGKGNSKRKAKSNKKSEEDEQQTQHTPASADKSKREKDRPKTPEALKNRLPHRPSDKSSIVGNRRRSRIGFGRMLTDLSATDPAFFGEPNKIGLEGP